MEYFNIVADEVLENDLMHYENLFTQGKGGARTKLLKHYKSIRDLIYILYHFRFKEVYDPNEICKKLKYKNVGNVEMLYKRLGWNKDGTYQQNRAFSMANTNKLRSEIDKLTPDELEDVLKKHHFNLYCQDIEGLKIPTTYKTLGFTSPEECLKVLFYLTRELLWTPLDIAQSSKNPIGHRRIQTFLMQIKMNTDQETGIYKSLSRGNKDITKTAKTGRLTKSKFREKKQGSISEDKVRTRLMEMLTFFLDPSL